MSEAKHTPGPWRWSKDYNTGDGRETWSLIGSYGYGILSCDGVANSPQGLGHTSNANLIAAAPDLLAACKEAMFAWAHGVGSVTTSDDPDTRANADRNIREGKRIMGVIESAIRKAEGGAG